MHVFLPKDILKLPDLKRKCSDVDVESVDDVEVFFIWECGR